MCYARIITLPILERGQQYQIHGAENSMISSDSFLCRFVIFQQQFCLSAHDRLYYTVSYTVSVVYSSSTTLFVSQVFQNHKHTTRYNKRARAGQGGEAFCLQKV